MTNKDLTLTATETAMMRKLMVDAQRVMRDNLKAYNYCRRALVLISKAERRRERKPRTAAANRLLMDKQIINDIFND